MVNDFFQLVYMFIQQNIVFSFVLVVILSLMLGSFYNVVIYRWPLQEKKQQLTDISEYLDELGIDKSPSFNAALAAPKIDISFPSSHCPQCGSTLKWWHNIPVLSYVLLKGKCSYCKSAIPLQYPAVELLTAIIIPLAFYFSGYNIFVLIFVALTWLILLIDYKTYTIPDGLSYSVLWITLLFSAFGLAPLTPFDTIIGAFSGFAVLWTIAKLGKWYKGVDVMGGGDIKLMAALTAASGAASIPFILLGASILGILTWLLFKFVYKDSQTLADNRVPFGPSLIVSAWLYILFHRFILNFLLYSG